MAENKDLYKLGQSVTGSLVDKGEEIRIDLQLDDNVISDSGTVFGKTTDDLGQPMEGVTIKIVDTNYNPKYHAITDDEGQYTIDNVEAGNQYLVLAVKDKYNLDTSTAFLMQKGQQIEKNFEMTLSEDASKSLVAGDIMNEDGDKLEGATVNLYDNSKEEPLLLKTTHTNQFGQYAFFDVSQGLYLVSASILGYDTAKTTFAITDKERVMNIDLTLIDDPVSNQGTINGVITDKNGLGIEGAFVILFEVTTDSQGKEVLTPVRKTLTNDEGVYLFEKVPQGNYKVKANKIEE